MMKNKRANILTDNSIKVILICFLAAILIGALIYKFSPLIKNTNSDTICQQTLERRAGLGGIGAQSAIPIKCQTKKICFVSKKSEECSEFKDLSEVEEKIIDKDYKGNLIKEITLIQYDAWKLLGQGKWDYAPSEFWTTKMQKSYCAPYARVAFSEGLRKEFEEEKILAYDFVDYQQKNLVPNTKTSFFRYLYGTDSFSEIDNQVKTEKGIDMTQIEFDISKQYYVMSIAMKDTWFKTIVGGVAGISAVFLASTGVGAIVLGAAGVAGGATIGYFISGDESSFIPPMLVEYDSSVINNLKCDEFDFSP